MSDGKETMSISDDRGYSVEFLNKLGYKVKGSNEKLGSTENVNGFLHLSNGDTDAFVFPYRVTEEYDYYEDHYYVVSVFDSNEPNGGSFISGSLLIGGGVLHNNLGVMFHKTRSKNIFTGYKNYVARDLKDHIDENMFYVTMSDKGKLDIIILDDDKLPSEHYWGKSEERPKKKGPPKELYSGPRKKNEAMNIGQEQGHNVGGIDLDPAMLDMQIKRDDSGVPLPVNMQPILEMNIQGFLPIIIDVTPVLNLPTYLGFADELPKNNDIAADDHSYIIKSNSRLNKHVFDLQKS
jgi:hypothetical protein